MFGGGALSRRLTASLAACTGASVAAAATAVTAGSVATVPHRHYTIPIRTPRKPFKLPYAGASRDAHDDATEISLKGLNPEAREPEEQVNLTFDPHLQYRFTPSELLPLYIDDLGQATQLSEDMAMDKHHRVRGVQYDRDVDYRHPVFGTHAYHMKPTQQRQREVARRRRRARKRTIEARISEALAIHPTFSSMQDNLTWNKRLFGTYDPSEEVIHAFYQTEKRMMGEHELRVKSAALSAELPADAKTPFEALAAHLRSYDSVTPVLAPETLRLIAQAKSAVEVDAIIAAASGISVPSVARANTPDATFASYTPAEAADALKSAANGDAAAAAAVVRQRTQAAIVAGLRARVLAVDAALPASPHERASVAQPVLLSAETGEPVPFTDELLAQYTESLKAGDKSTDVRSDDHLVDDVNHAARGDAMFALHRLTKMPPIPALTASSLGGVALNPDSIASVASKSSSAAAASAAAAATLAAAPRAVLASAAAEAALAYAAVAKAAADPAAKSLSHTLLTRERGPAFGPTSSTEAPFRLGATDVPTKVSTNTYTGLAHGFGATAGEVSGAVLDHGIRLAQMELMQEYVSICNETGVAVPDGLSPRLFDPRKLPYFAAAYPETLSAPGFRGYVAGVDARIATRTRSNASANSGASSFNEDGDSTANISNSYDSSNGNVIYSRAATDAEAAAETDAALFAQRLVAERAAAADARRAARDARLAGFARTEPADVTDRIASALRPNQFAQDATFAKHNVFRRHLAQPHQIKAEVALAEHRQLQQQQAGRHNPARAELVSRIVERNNTLAADAFAAETAAEVPAGALALERVKDAAVYSQTGAKVRRGVSRAIHQRIAKDLLAQGFDARHVERLLREYQIDYSDLVQNSKSM